MSDEPGLDICLPIGALFTTLGILLVIFGLMTAHDIALYAPSDSMNINLGWGAVMTVFGLAFLAIARRTRRGKRQRSRKADMGQDGIR